MKKHWEQKRDRTRLPDVEKYNCLKAKLRSKFVHVAEQVDSIFSHSKSNVKIPGMLNDNINKKRKTSLVCAVKHAHIRFEEHLILFEIVINSPESD